MWRGLIALVIIALPAISGSRKSITPLIIDAVLFVVLLTLAVVRGEVTRWRVDDRTLRVETGLLRRSSKRFPLGQLHAIDVVQPGAARVLGLAELRLRLAGGAGDQGRLAYLPNRPQSNCGPGCWPSPTVWPTTCPRLLSGCCCGCRRRDC